MKTVLHFVLAALIAGLLNLSPVAAAETNVAAPAAMDAATARNAQMLAATLEPILNRQHQRELDIVQSANRTIFIGVGVVAVAGLIGFLLLAWIFSRAMRCFSEMAAQQGETVRALGAGRIPAALGPGDAAAVAASAEQSSARFMSAIERLEKRIHELEATTPGGLLDTEAGGPSSKPTASANPAHHRGANGQQAANPESAKTAASRLDMLVGKGQSLLSLDQSEAALAAFEEVLALQPDHADALVKKGLVLEKLQRLDEAVACYDHAIALDESLTVAWLHKGGICNRLERHQEALECYEQAIRREQKSGA